MSGLANLSRLVEAATPGPWHVERTESLSVVDDAFIEVAWIGAEPYEEQDEENSRLIASAPVLAALLIECEEALRKLADAAHPNSTCNICVACRALARLAGFDAQLGDRQ